MPLRAMAPGACGSGPSSPPAPRALHRLAIAALPLVLNACGLVDAMFTVPEFAPEARQTPAEPVPPIASNRFVLPAGDDAVGEIQIVTARHEDTFVEIARSYGLGFDELRQANPGVDPWLPGEGTRVVLPTRFLLPVAPRRGIVLNVAARRLFYFPPTEAGQATVVETYPIGIGRTGWATPTGEATVIAKARDPVWFVPASIRAEHAAAGDPLPPQVPPGPDNPLGAHVLGLSLPGYLIHGTNKPAGVGMRVSHGCVRLYPEDIEGLYDRIPLGTEVRIVDQPFLIGRQNGDLLLEAHSPLAEDERDWPGSLEAMARAALVEHADPSAQLDPERLAQIGQARRGFPASVLRGGPSMDQSLRLARHVINVIEHEAVADAELAAAEP